MDQRTSELMQILAETLDEALNGPRWRVDRKIGFALLVYPFGDNQPHRDRINYVGNGKREDVLVAIKELAARWEGRHVETTTKQ